MAYRDSISFGFGLTPWVKRLIIANAAMFLLLWLAPFLEPWLEFAPARALTRPWTAVTYMFVHDGFLHLLFNMLGLFFFGPPLEARWGPREFLKYYLICGLGGAALSFVFGLYGSVVGASGAVFGVMLAFAMNWPDAPIYFWGIFPIPAKWLVGILAAMALFSAISGASDGVAHLAHLGGFAAGFLYLKLDDKVRVRLSRLKRALPKRKLTVVPGGSAASKPPAPPRRKDEERLLDEVDRVLDKISSSGLASLTPEERRILDEVSRRYRRN
ncbi:MAG TPA: rhomboid family intramembrane serine protease [Longimicrobiales bacterium]